MVGIGDTEAEEVTVIISTTAIIIRPTAVAEEITVEEDRSRTAFTTTIPCSRASKTTRYDVWSWMLRHWIQEQKFSEICVQGELIVGLDLNRVVYEESLIMKIVIRDYPIKVTCKVYQNEDINDQKQNVFFE